MKKSEKGKLIAGLILVLLGLSLSGINIFAGFGENLFLLLLGGLFIAWYFYKNAYGLLIPGCILAGLGLGSFGSNIFWSSPHQSTLGIGIGFIAVYVIDLLNNGKTHWWPLIPGGIMTVSSLAKGPFGFRNFFKIGWPIIIIILGLWIIARSTGIIKCKEKKDEQ